jgi:hypothetical protein
VNDVRISLKRPRPDSRPVRSITTETRQRDLRRQAWVEASRPRIL